ncbi:MAG: Hsp20 family protein [Deltaproteobacteria bacterium]|nr:Hsp20 family protein [Deltaproteobacteria bacterium]
MKQVTNLTLTRLSSFVMRAMHPRSVSLKIPRHPVTLSAIFIIFFVPRVVFAGHSDGFFENDGFKAADFIRDSNGMQQQGPEDEDASLDNFRDELNEVIKNKLRRNLYQKIFHKDRRGDFLIDDIKIDETKDQYIYRIDIPSCHFKTVKVFIKNSTIVLYDDLRQRERQTRQAALYARNKLEGLFHRVIPIPNNVRTDDLQPMQKNGVMIIALDKIKPEV